MGVKPLARMEYASRRGPGWRQVGALIHGAAAAVLVLHAKIRPPCTGRVAGPRYP